MSSNDIPEPTRMTPEIPSLLYTMFHIRNRPFDQVIKYFISTNFLLLFFSQLLTGEWNPDWYHLLKIPMGLSADRIWQHVSKRWEFRDQSSLSQQEAQIVANITKFLKPN